ncbi:efflux RND transporter permease subunit [Actinotalea sp. M2MS4P-6]|uniref:efflux RND transporter permease subunit n=1 Tax=Actinotalea sp. M2MS4P-6 TaxID=2983762 RepID=UPI0021E50C3A|nr:efflux RND transporter permease subunit [Actinotalea sp. M2MS4P-6]MCV2393794.1 efflux RND transporter permease subunit [Actinotalea sp. M2MS4P-6]
MSWLARGSLANRSVVTLLALGIAVFGVLSAGALKQELIPSLQIPTAVVLSIYPGASPQIVEQQVTVPVEDAVGTVTDVETVSATSSTGLSVVTVQLRYGVDLDQTAQALQQAVTRSAATLPSSVSPTVFTGSIDQFPVIQLAVSGGEDEAALSALLDEQVVPRLAEIPGVRDVEVTGTQADQVVLETDPLRLAAAGVSLASLSTLLQDNGLVLPGGTITEGDVSKPVQVGSRITSLDELAALPLTTTDGGVTTVGAVADVQIQPTTLTSYSRLNGQPSLAISVTKTPDGNTVEISHGVTDVLDEVSARLGGDVEVAVVFDQAPYIEESINGLATEGGLGLAFAVLVILLFLASLRSTLVSAISIPMSLLVTFIALRVGGYSLNILTLGAMTIAIGRVVDDSIVVIENIKRHLSYGEPKTKAILGAVREVAGAITSSTVATVAVFLPIGLVGGMVGELFRPFAFTVAIAMGASLLVALTLVPVLASWFLKAPPDPDPAATRAAAEAKERRSLLARAYLPTLRWSVAHPVITLVLALGVFAGTLALVPRLETTFIGDSGQDTLTVTETFAPGTSLAAQDADARVVEQALMDTAGVATVQSTVGSASGLQAAFGGSTPTATFAVTLADGTDVEQADTDVRAALADLDVLGEVALAGGDSGFGSSTVDVLVTAADDTALTTAADQVTAAVAGLSSVTDVTNNLSADQPTVEVAIDGASAAAAGLSEAQLAGTVAALTNPQPIGQVTVDGTTMDVRVDAITPPQSVAELQAFPLPTAAGAVPLGQVAEVSSVDSPTSLSRVDGSRAATVSATPVGQDLGAVTREISDAIDAIDLPAGVDVTVGGVAADQQDAFADLGLALLAAIGIVYLVMVATFRSLVQPLVLLVSVPFAATGALLMLLGTGTPLGVAALIGLLMLVGIVVTNAIVLIDLVNQYREQGRGLAEAVTEGARKRLRPILMTAAATILALTPMALGLTGGGVFISRPLALVVIGGLITSTLLTLVIVPVLYTLVERLAGRFRRGREPEHLGGAHTA